MPERRFNWLRTELERRPNWLLTSLVAGGAVVGSGLNSYFDGPRQSWHFADEGWFGRYTASGGADKAAHFVDYYIISKELANLFVVLGHKPEHARWLGFGVSALTGLVTEVGDGATRYGFSYQDFVMDFGGALAAALISAARAEDLVGFRHGFLLSESSGDRCCPFPGFNRDYSNEIYTADLQLAGVARRLGVKIGPIKYLLLSVTYGTKGYPGGADGQRQVGFELGLNFSQMLNDLDVTRDRWWGYLLHVVFDNVRFPYTAVGSATTSITGAGTAPTPAIAVTRARIRAHLLRWRPRQPAQRTASTPRRLPSGAASHLDPSPRSSRVSPTGCSSEDGPTRFVGALDSRLNVQRVRLAGCLRAPPRIWTLLLALAGSRGMERA